MPDLTPARATYLTTLVDQQDRGRRAIETGLVAALLATWRQFFLTGAGSVRARNRRGTSLQAQAAAASSFAITAAQASYLYQEEDVRALALRLSEQALDAQRQAYNLQREFQRRTLADLEVKAPPLQGGRPTGRTGIDPAEVYLRPAETFRWERSRGTSPEQALEAATARLQRLAEDDVMLASRDGAMDVLSTDELPITGYRRILRPELSETGSCGLCIVAADRVYKRSELMALHGRCHCTVMAVREGDDPGLELNGDDLEKLYAAAGVVRLDGRATDGPALKRVRAVVHENGELGPVLAAYGDNFLDPETVAERRRAARKATATA